MKSVHKALQLRHHKHTGKLLAHKHTSYRVLFLLMLVPIIAMALVDQAVKASDDIVVSAKIPAPMPTGAPVISSPEQDATVTSENVVITGTCPVITPAVIIAIYDNGTLIGSAQCGADGTFSIPVTLSYGPHTLVATVVTITHDVGASSQPLTLTYQEPVAPAVLPSTKPTGASVAPGSGSFGPPVRIVASDIYVTIDPNGHAVWHGSFADGTAPYSVRINWGDGTITEHKAADQAKQEYSHDYRKAQTYKIIIQVTDANGDTSTLYSVGISLSLETMSAMAMNNGGGAVSGGSTSQTANPAVSFVQKYVWQIYIGTLSGLSFLWYLEHGRHIIAHTKSIGRLHHR